MTATIVLLGILIVGLSDRGLRTQLLDIAQQAWTAAPPIPESASETVPGSESAASCVIPAPDRHGVITLTQPGPYVIREISTVGPLTIQAADNVRPRLVIASDPWSLTAGTVTLKNIDLEWAGSATSLEPSSLIELRTQRFQITGCRFFNSHPADDDSPPLLAAVTWTPADRRDPQAGLHEIRDSQFLGPMQAVICRLPPRQMSWRNVLKTHGGTALAVSSTESTTGVKFELHQVTLRDSGSLLSCAGPLVEQASASSIEIDAENSVFDVARHVSLVELLAPEIRPDWPQSIRFTGDGCLIPPEATLVSWSDPQQSAIEVLNSDELQFEGLFTDQFEFAGPLSADPRDSMIVKTRAPRRPEAPPPGMNAAQFTP